MDTEFCIICNQGTIPELGRFINADSVTGARGELLSHNLFAYCSNNPISRVDEGGHWWQYVVACAATVVGGVTAILGIPEEIAAAVVVVAAVVTFKIIQKVSIALGNAIEETYRSHRALTESKEKEKKLKANQGALDKLGKDLEDDYRRNGKRVTKGEAEIIDGWCDEYGVSQHHKTDRGRDGHWVGGNHTHIRKKHIAYED